MRRYTRGDRGRRKPRRAEPTTAADRERCDRSASSRFRGSRHAKESSSCGESASLASTCSTSRGRPKWRPHITDETGSGVMGGTMWIGRDEWRQDQTFGGPKADSSVMSRKASLRRPTTIVVDSDCRVGPRGSQRRPRSSSASRVAVGEAIVWTSREEATTSGKGPRRTSPVRWSTLCSRHRIGTSGVSVDFEPGARTAGHTTRSVRLDVTAGAARAAWGGRAKRSPRDVIWPGRRKALAGATSNPPLNT